jgi:hypothetical protein
MAPPDPPRQLRLAPDLGHGHINATPAGRGRKKDEDTNVTNRDVAALTWLGEQYGARADVLRVLLARLGVQGEGQLGERTLRQITERWADTGLATRYRLLGHQWVVPTGKALHLVGLGFKPWSPVVTQLNHIHAVGIARLALELGTDANLAIPEGGRWIGERQLRRDRTVTASVAGSVKDRPPRTKDYDGAVELPEAEEQPTRTGLYGEEVEQLTRRIAIEVELSRKSGLRIRELVRTPRNSRYLRTVYFAPPEVGSFVRGQIDRAQAKQPPERRHDYWVLPLPEVEGVTYGGAQ